MPEQEDAAIVLQRLEHLERQIQDLAKRVERIEQRTSPTTSPQPQPSTASEPSDTREVLSAQPIIPPPPVVPPLSEEVAKKLASVAAQVPPPPEPTPPAAAPSFESQSSASGYWEHLVGGKGALWIGSIATFFALAFFLAYAWQLLTDVGRLAVGFASGLALLALGERSRRRAERWFSEGISGAGIAVFYLTIWAGVQRYHLLSFEVSFALMAATVLVGVLLALRYDAISLSVLATIGSFLTPVLLRAPGGAPTTPYPLLTYLTVLNTGILAVSLYRQWRSLVWLSFGATVLLLLGWAVDSYTPQHQWTVFAFVTINFVLFLGCACFRSLAQRDATQPQELMLVFADTFVYTLAGYALIGDALGRYPSAFALLLAALFGLLAFLVYQVVPQNRNLQDSLTGLAVFYLVIAVPLQLRQDWLVVGWSVLAAVLVTLGLRLPSRLLHVSGQIVWGLAWLALLWVLLTVEPARKLLLLNERGLPLMVATLATTWMAVQARRATHVKDELASLYSATATLSGAWLLAQETYQMVQWQASRFGQNWQAAAMYLVALVWAVAAPLAYLLGARVRDVWVRFCALMVALLAAMLPVWAMAAMPVETWTPFWNLRWFSAMLVAGLLALLAGMVAAERERVKPEEADALGLLVALVGLLLLIGLSAEVYFGFRFWLMPSAPQEWAFAAWFGLATLWSLFAALFVVLGLVWALFALRVLGYSAALGALVVLVVISLQPLPESSTALVWTPLWNLRALAFLATTGAMGAIAFALASLAPRSTASEVSLVGGVNLTALAVLLWGITQETYAAFYYWHSRGIIGDNWQRMAQMAISLAWTLFGAALLIVGVIRALQPVRLAALGLLGVTALKVFLFDLSFLDTPLRILSFGGLGLTLIAISWLYSRYGIGRQSSLRHS